MPEHSGMVACMDCKSFCDGAVAFANKSGIYGRYESMRADADVWPEVNVARITEVVGGG